jgi:hypothetical protein
MEVKRVTYSQIIDDIQSLNLKPLDEAKLMYCLDFKNRPNHRNFSKRDAEIMVYVDYQINTNDQNYMLVKTLQSDIIDYIQDIKF